MIDELWQVHPVFLDYEVSTLGRVRRATAKKGTRIGRMKVPSLGTTGYLTVNVDRKPRKVHVLVLETFVGFRPHKHDGLHIDGNKTNNRLSNLRWGTRKENMADARAHGTLRQGEQHGRSKLTEVQVLCIRAMAASGTLLKDIAPLYGVSRGHISEIVARKTWASV
jgi:hypothetical protein